MFSPLGLVMIAGFIVLVLLALTNKSAKWYILSFAVYISTLGNYGAEWIDNTLAFPLNEVRGHGRLIACGLLVALVLPVIIAPRGWRTRLIPGSVATFFMLQMCLSLSYLRGGLFARGVMGGTIFLLIFFVFGVGLSRWMQTIQDVNKVLRCFAFMGVLVVLGTIYQLAVNSSAIVWAGRLLGTTGNAQHAAAIFSLILPLNCYLLFQRGGSKTYRLAIMFVTSFMVIFLLWTGSRTGLLMLAIGLGLTFRVRLGKILAVAVVIGGLATGVMSYYTSQSDDGIQLERLTSTADTRTAAWARLIEDFRSSPVFGVTHQGAFIAESSYLSLAARAGIIGLIPMFGMFFFVIREIWHLQRFKSQLPEYDMLIDLVIAEITAILVGAFLEGYLLGALAFPVFMLYANLIIAQFMADAVRWSKRDGVNIFANGVFSAS